MLVMFGFLNKLLHGALWMKNTDGYWVRKANAYVLSRFFCWIYGSDDNLNMEWSLTYQRIYNAWRHMHGQLKSTKTINCSLVYLGNLKTEWPIMVFVQTPMENKVQWLEMHFSSRSFSTRCSFSQSATPHCQERWNVSLNRCREMLSTCPLRTKTSVTLTDLRCSNTNHVAHPNIWTRHFM